MNPKALLPWSTLARRTLIDQGRFLRVESHTVGLPDGRVIPDWTWVAIPDAAIVLPVTPEGRFLCFRQTKYALGTPCLAPVGGMIEPGEEPLEAARRELREEMGCTAAQWINLGSYILDPNRGVATMHLFLALGAVPTSAPSSDDLEEQELLSLDRNEIEQAVASGQFRILAWTAVVSLALRLLDARGGRVTPP